MLTQIDTTGAARTITQLTQVDAGGTLRVLTQLWQNDLTNTPRQIFSSTGGSGAVGSLSPDSVYGYGNSARTITVSTGQAGVSGAPAAATFVWHFDTTGWAAVAPGGRSTAFKKNVGPGEDTQCQVYCTVTVGSASYNTNTITAYASNFGGGPIR